MSRDLKELHPAIRRLAEAHIAYCKERGVDLLIYYTYRSPEEQAELYKKGRDGNTEPKVTNARPWASMHQYRVAYDAAPKVNGKIIWDIKRPEWKPVIEGARVLGIEWAGLWVSFPESVHFQKSCGVTQAELKAAGLGQSPHSELQGKIEAYLRDNAPKTAFA